jgi:hypothetical protein
LLDDVILRSIAKAGMVATLKFDETPRNTSAGPVYNVWPQRFASLGGVRDFPLDTPPAGI